MRPTFMLPCANSVRQYEEMAERVMYIKTASRHEAVFI